MKKPLSRIWSAWVVIVLEVFSHTCYCTVSVCDLKINVYVFQVWGSNTPWPTIYFCPNFVNLGCANYSDQKLDVGIQRNSKKFSGGSQAILYINTCIYYNRCRLSVYMSDENITQHLMGFNYLNQSQLTNLTMIGWDKRNLSHAPGKPWEVLKFAVGSGNVLICPVHAWATTTISFLLYLAVMFWAQ